MIQALTWDYPEHGDDAEPEAEAVLQEINGRGADGALLSGFGAAEAETAPPRAAPGSTPALSPTA